ncbi:Protein of unknown function [Lentibacillus halodurans]|uniref:DUF4127 family protein n=1 Tax=Lentibacillus halodurans TaxID=237679 RepID=A0A1I0VIB2_9BACI|nr:DUF4127 family protein [Lentibacillus halodurans]SFA75938.1 Protein of unknown function [Lentibacillus halodurans]
MKFFRMGLVLILAVFVFFSVNSVSANGSKPGLANLMMIPLDDRPANLYFPEKVGKSAGVNVINPPEEMIGYYNTPGNSEEVGQWVVENSDQADGFVISTSMLAYGGLIASRTGVKSLEEAMENIQNIKELKEKHPDKPVYVYDTIQRLAVTAISEESREYYDLIREWAILYDKVHNLGMEEDRERLEELEHIIPESVLNDYLEARERNHEVNKQLIDWAEKGYIDYLVLAQDDANPYGLHRAEREILSDKVKSDGLENKVAIFPGADEVDVVLVSRFASQFYRKSSSFYVEYGGIDGADWVAPLEDTPFDENVAKHIESAGGVMTEDEDGADIHLLLNTPSEETSRREADINGMIDRVNEWVAEDNQVAIGDVLSVNRADEPFVKGLANQVDLTKIRAYSGWNTAGNALGITVGHAAAREAFLSQKSGFGVPYYKETAEAHYEFLLHRYAMDQGYKNVVKPEADEFITEIGANPWQLDDDYDTVNQFVRDSLKNQTEMWYKQYFKGKEVYLGSRGKKDFHTTIGNLERLQVELPWPRTFETELEPDLEF